MPERISQSGKSFRNLAKVKEKIETKRSKQGVNDGTKVVAGG
jgi:hypothetical protein